MVRQVSRMFTRRRILTRPPVRSSTGCSDLFVDFFRRERPARPLGVGMGQPARRHQRRESRSSSRSLSRGGGHWRISAFAVHTSAYSGPQHCQRHVACGSSPATSSSCAAPPKEKKKNLASITLQQVRRQGRRGAQADHAMNRQGTARGACRQFRISCKVHPLHHRPRLSRAGLNVVGRSTHRCLSRGTGLIAQRGWPVPRCWSRSIPHRHPRRRGVSRAASMPQ